MNLALDMRIWSDNAFKTAYKSGRSRGEFSFSRP